MGLKSIFNTMKTPNGLIIPRLDQYLLSLNEEKNDRAINVNAPSQVGGCMRCNFYARCGYEKDTNAIEPRARRIFDNGTKTHERLQEYLMKEGVLLLDEVPLRNDDFNIQGHTDGFLAIGESTLDEIAILEIKSINSRGFEQLKTAKDAHKMQAQVYMYCAEMRRRFLKNKYKTQEDLDNDYENREKYYESLYQHIQSGKKHSREDKIAYQVELNDICDTLLFNVKKPISRVIFLYENKDNQDVKEFCVEWSDDLVEKILEEYSEINGYVLKKKIPPRGGTSKSSDPCRWCNYKLECYN